MCIRDSTRPARSSAPRGHPRTRASAAGTFRVASAAAPHAAAAASVPPAPQRPPPAMAVGARAQTVGGGRAYAN
eukprot:2496175-Prymnesium_polylepis.1